MQRVLDDAFRQILTTFKLEAKRAMFNVHVALERDSADVDRDIAQHVVVLTIWLERWRMRPL